MNDPLAYSTEASVKRWQDSLGKTARGLMMFALVDVGFRVQCTETEPRPARGSFFFSTKVRKNMTSAAIASSQ